LGLLVALGRWAHDVGHPPDRWPLVPLAQQLSGRPRAYALEILEHFVSNGRPCVVEKPQLGIIAVNHESRIYYSLFFGLRNPRSPIPAPRRARVEGSGAPTESWCDSYLIETMDTGKVDEILLLLGFLLTLGYPQTQRQKKRGHFFACLRLSERGITKTRSRPPYPSLRWI